MEGTNGSDGMEVNGENRHNIVNARGGDDTINIGAPGTGSAHQTESSGDNQTSNSFDAVNPSHSDTSTSTDNLSASEDEGQLPTSTNDTSETNNTDKGVTDSGQAPGILSQIDQKEIDAMGPNANKEDYIIAKAKDGDYHIYEKADEDEARSGVELAHGSNKLHMSGKTTISQDESGIDVVEGGARTGSPLILDMDGNGVEAQTNRNGVDIDRNGVGDGSASGADKMLAMSDQDGNGIDGTEVFGDQTINPFTGEKTKGTNGFDALREIAQSAQKKTGAENIIDKNGMVDLQALNTTLHACGYGSLGLISDDNTTTLESLDNVSKISTSYSQNQYDQGDAVQHRQSGQWVDNTDTAHQVEDVWFQLQ